MCTLKVKPHNLSEAFSSARATGKSESLLTTIYIFGLKVALQIELLRARPTTLGEAFSLAYTITSLQSEVASLKAKGSLDANKKIKNDHILVHELEKQEEKLAMELQLKNNFREALETTSKDLGKTMLDLNPTLHDLQKVSVDQKKKHYKTTHALNIVDEEFKKAKSEATTKIRNLAKALPCALLRSNPTTLSEAFSKGNYLSSCKGERWPNTKIKLLRARPTTLGEAFSLACIIKARFEAIVHEENATAEKEKSIKETTDTITSLQTLCEEPIERIPVYSRKNMGSWNQDFLGDTLRARWFRRSEECYALRSADSEPTNMLEIRSCTSEIGFKYCLSGLYHGIARNIASSAPISAIYTFSYESVKGVLLKVLENGRSKIASLMLKALLTIVTLVMVNFSMGVQELSFMVSFGFNASIRVGNKLGAWNPKAAAFSVWMVTIVSFIIESLIFAHCVAVGYGWQAYVAYVNIRCYYVVRILLGFLLGFYFDLGVKGIWPGMIRGTGMQTLILLWLSAYDIFGSFYATRGKQVEFDETRKVIVVQILKHEPCLISLDVEGFYDRDIDSIKYAARMELFFPNKSDDEIVEGSVIMSRTMYAQLMQQTFQAPKGYLMSPRSGNGYPVTELGMKIACGFQMIYQTRKQEGLEGKRSKCEVYRESLKRSGYFEGLLPGVKRV
ncbi:protein ecdysoneless [Tanacetum coccineum]